MGFLFKLVPQFLTQNVTQNVVYLKLKRELLLCKAEQTIITQNEDFVHQNQS